MYNARTPSSPMIGAMCETTASHVSAARSAAVRGSAPEVCASRCRISWGRFIPPFVMRIILASRQCSEARICGVRTTQKETLVAKGCYEEASIRVLKGLEPVKERPGMYTRTADPTHIVQEVIDNSADEALGG